ncbi:hypothetical protein O9X80_11185 [Agrobacterium salinitolerans]|uniref:hypothetical protein n=1 Tax=Agrobacterium salinitolerans TaxID=1183413 RepID=UPI0022B816B7|nr:hypothetical protein [Agrobacterium salinitolerans]MCZ7975051.1 hypothetical protein [Agrobacterium salinitolerans]
MEDNDIVMMHLGELVERGKVEYWPSPYHKVVMERDGESVKIHHEFFDDPLFKENQKLKNDFNKTGSHGDFVHMATMSEGMFFELHKQGRMDYDEDIRKVLNDPTYAGIKVNDWKA